MVKRNPSSIVGIVVKEVKCACIARVNFTVVAAPAQLLVDWLLCIPTLCNSSPAIYDHWQG